MEVERHELDRAKLVEAANACACANFRKASRVITQYTLMVPVALMGSPIITQLAEEIVIDRTTLTRDLKVLEGKGLVEISPGTDRRTRVVEITDAGRWPRHCRSGNRPNPQ
jgi:hypothetical protein